MGKIVLSSLQVIAPRITDDAATSFLSFPSRHDRAFRGLAHRCEVVPRNGLTPRRLQRTRGHRPWLQRSSTLGLRRGGDDRTASARGPAKTDDRPLERQRCRERRQWCRRFDL